MARCLHGYEQGHCLICEALATTTVDTDDRGGSHRSWLPGGRLPGRPPATTATGLVAERHHHPLATLALVAVVLMAAVLAGWVLLGAVYAILRILEIVAVAFAAGWVGYRVGHWQGRHER